MSFMPLAMKLAASLRDSLPAAPTVVELGNQSFNPTLNGILTKDEDQIFPVLLRYLDQRGKPYDRAALERLASLSVAEQKAHTATFFKALGFASYDAIDLNSRYGSLIMDLNLDLREHYGFDRTFDLVTNIGTGEHIFNQYAVVRNAHNLTKVGGIMLFVLPFHNWMNHGFFNFNPILFGDLAAANGYRILRLSVGLSEGAELGVRADGTPTDEIALQWQPQAPGVRVDDMQRRGSIKPLTLRTGIWWLAQTIMGRKPVATPLPLLVSKLAERSSNILVVAALQKTQAADFAAPLQGMYAGSNVESDTLRSAYQHRAEPLPNS